MNGELPTGKGSDSGPLTVLLAGGGTGGHLMPALAIAAAIRRTHPEWRLVLVGAKRGIEAGLLPSRDYPFHLLSTEPIYRRQWWKNFRWPLIWRRVMREANAVLDLEKPHLVIGTGGYASGPVVWRAVKRGIPTALLELNAYPGLAVRWLAASVREVWLGVPEARRHLKTGPTTQILDTGTPIIPPDLSLRPRALQWFGLDPERPVVLITGGSQGSLAINQAVAGWIEAGGSAGMQVLWVTGKGTIAQFGRFDRPPETQVFDFLDPMAHAYAVADVAVARAGMMTLAELCAWGIPSILIPLPAAAADHQTPNARVIEEAGAGIHLPQSRLDARRLGDLLTTLLSDRPRWEVMRAAACARGRPEAAEQIVARIGVLSG